MKNLFSIDYDTHAAYKSLSPNLGLKIRVICSWSLKLIISAIAVLISISSSYVRTGKKKLVNIESDFTRDGVVFCTDKLILAKLGKLMNEHIEALSSQIKNVPPKSRKFSTCLSGFTRSDHADLLQKIEKEMLALPAVCSALDSTFRTLSKVKLVHMNLHINQETDHFVFKHGKNDLIHEDTNFFHVDTNLNTVKSMVYLTQVKSQQNGAFEFVIGSHKFHSTLLLILHRAIKKIGAVDRDDRSKERLLCLPRWARQKNEFSDYDTKSKLGVLLRLNQRAFTGDCDFIVFNPLGIHRGGRVSEGRRIALQLVFSDDDFSWRIL